MSKNNHDSMDEAYWIKRGYVADENGVLIPPRTQTGQTLVVNVAKEKVNNSPDFEVKPVTEWFVKGYSVPSKKNSRQNFIGANGKQISIPSKKHAEYKKMTALQYQIFGIEFRRTVKELGLKYPLRIEFTFVRSTKHRFDYTNSIQSVEDILVSAGWIEDDSADHLIPSVQPYEYDKNCGGVRIKLLTNE